MTVIQQAGEEGRTGELPRCQRCRMISVASLVVMTVVGRCSDELVQGCRAI